MIFAPTGVLSYLMIALLGGAQGDARLADASSVTRAAPAPEVRRVIIRNQLILRVPLRPRQQRVTRFQLVDGPRCFASQSLSGARLSGERTIDFLLRDQRLLRVRMENDCKSLDFYGGFYLQPTDGRLCAGRDAIRTRMGGSCQIEQFQLIQPVSATAGN